MLPLVPTFLEEHENSFRQTIDSVGLILLDKFGCVQFITTQAAQWLQKYFPLSETTVQLPGPLSSWFDHQVSCSRNAHSCHQAFLSERFGKQLTIRFRSQSSKGKYLLFLEEKDAPLTSLKLLGLSEREAEVLLWIIKGQDNKVIARKLSVHISTLRKHLENIYRKLGVQSRTEAVVHSLERLGVLY